MIQWDDHLLTGNERIDAEHRMFFDLISHYSAARTAGAPAERLIRILDEVVLYARFHFKSEENLMQDAGYPDLRLHREQHHALTQDLSNNLAGLKIGLYPAERVEAFLLDWFVAHVTHEDNKISRFILASG